MLDFINHPAIEVVDISIKTLEWDFKLAPESFKCIVLYKEVKAAPTLPKVTEPIKQPNYE